MQPQFITLHPRAKDITGQKFGRLTVLGPIGRTSGKKILWLCRCDCGNESSVQAENLKSGHTQSCGCRVRETIGNLRRTHGMTNDRIYHVWRGMIARCTNPRNPKYPSYGGRGIAICDDWRHDFCVFYDYVSQLPYFDEENITLDRIDNNGNYEEGNVRWSLPLEQSRNTSRNIWFTHNGQTKCVADWGQEFALNYSTIRTRLARGWDVERALMTPIRKKHSSKKRRGNA